MVLSCSIYSQQIRYMLRFIYLPKSLVQTSRTVNPVTTAFYSLHWAHTVIGETSPTYSLIVNVLEGAN